MDPFVQKHLNKAFEIATELDRQNYMFENNLTEAANLEDMDAYNNRLLIRQKNNRRRDFEKDYMLNVYCCYVGLDITNNFYKNIYDYKKLPYKMRKGENVLAKLKHVNVGADFQ